MYKITDDFSELLKSDANLYFVDIEETLLAPNLYYKYVSKPKYHEEFMRLCSGLPIHDVLYYGKNYKRYLFQKSARAVIEQLQAKGAMVFALTTGYPSRQKRAKIKGMHINFDGYLFAKGMDKGPFLVNFLDNNVNLTGDCLFIDNDEQKIVNVYYYFKDRFGDSRQIDLILYNRVYKYHISLKAFSNYWKGVVNLLSNKLAVRDEVVN